MLGASISKEKLKSLTVPRLFVVFSLLLLRQSSGVDPGFFLGGGALVSCSTSTYTLHNTSCIRKPQFISGGGAHPLHPRSAPGPVVDKTQPIYYAVIPL